MSKGMKNLIKLILVSDPASRLELNEIQEHPFFNKVDWEAVGKLEMTPPYVPKETTNETAIIAKYKNVKLEIDEGSPRKGFNSMSQYNRMRVDNEFRNF